MAMIIIAPKSSITANAVKKTFNEVGTLLPNKDKIPNAKAMSVAIGIPAPDCVAVPRLNNKTAMPELSYHLMRQRLATKHL